MNLGDYVTLFSWWPSNAILDKIPTIRNNISAKIRTSIDN